MAEQTDEARPVERRHEDSETRQAEQRVPSPCASQASVFLSQGRQVLVDTHVTMPHSFTPRPRVETSVIIPLITPGDGVESVVTCLGTPTVALGGMTAHVVIRIICGSGHPRAPQCRR